MSFKYQELANYYREKISAGELSPGERMCTEAELVEQFHISRKTARQALGELKKAGLIRSRRGAGTFVRAADGGRKRKSKAVRNVILLFIDTASLADSYESHLASALSKLAGPENLSLSVRYLTTGDFFDEQAMKNLRGAGADLFWVDGFVTEAHEYLLMQLDIPYLLIGDWPQLPHGPQIKYDWQALGSEAAEYLCQAADYPVVAISKPLQNGGNPYYFYSGIQRACRRNDRPLLLYMSSSFNDFDATPLLNDHFRLFGDSKFSLVTSPHFLGSVEKALLLHADRRFDAPIAVAGAQHLITPSSYPKVRYFNFNIDEYATQILAAHRKLVDSLVRD